jgi:hypothetical protein
VRIDHIGFGMHKPESAAERLAEERMVVDDEKAQHDGTVLHPFAPSRISSVAAITTRHFSGDGVGVRVCFYCAAAKI